MNHDWLGDVAPDEAPDDAAGGRVFPDADDDVFDIAQATDLEATDVSFTASDELPDEPPDQPDQPVAGPSGWELPEPTGVESVDEALEPLLDLDQLATADHVAVYEEAHRKLQDALADLDGPTSGP